MALAPDHDLRKTLKEAVGHHQRGRLDRAAYLYRRVLKAHPRQPDALHLLGLIDHQQGRPAQAEGRIAEAIAVNGQAPAYRNSLGTVLLALGRAREAEA